MTARSGLRAAAWAVGLASLLAAGAARADGALALGVPEDIAADGVAIGVAVRLTSDLADKEAVSQCKVADTKQSTRALCAVAGHFINQCVAIAYNPADGTPGFGWAIADDHHAAEAAALKNCEAADGEQGLCIVGGSACDGLAIP